MSPTVLKVGGLRFYFFSLEEDRPHIHVQGPGGEAKFWLDPAVELARNWGLDRRNLGKAQRVIEEQENEIRAAWKKHFER